MNRLAEEIAVFLEGKGFECSRQMRDGFDIICAGTADGRVSKVILPLEVSSLTPAEAVEASDRALECLEFMRVIAETPLIVTEDRWRLQKDMMQERLLAHLEVFGQAFARNCEVRRIEKPEAHDFLMSNHSYGDAACRYRYGLFLKRQTGHLAADAALVPGTLLAVATFSNARKWVKGGREIRSYEWTRYASLPGVRVNGGMGKMLKAFIEDVGPDDVMSYADLEWSRGDVYRQLGFVLEGQKKPVLFSVDPGTWKRSPVRPGAAAQSVGPGFAGQADPVIAEDPAIAEDPVIADDPAIAGPTVIPVPTVIAGQTGNLYFRNFGSNKYRLKLTDYE